MQEHQETLLLLVVKLWMGRIFSLLSIIVVVCQIFATRLQKEAYKKQPKSPNHLPTKLKDSTPSSWSSIEGEDNVGTKDYVWLPSEAVIHANETFWKLEEHRLIVPDPVNNRDRRSSSPFLTGDSFRSHCSPHLCEEDGLRVDLAKYRSFEGNNCRFVQRDIKNGSCVFIKSGMLHHFLQHVMPTVNVSLRLFTDHLGDQAVPDGQDLPHTTMAKWQLGKIMQKYYDEGKLLAHHGINLHWSNYSRGGSRPEFSHCVPIGLETRDNTYGKRPSKYLEFMMKNIINRPQHLPKHLYEALYGPRAQPYQHGMRERPWLLAAFEQSDKKPDRRIAAQQLSVNGWEVSPYSLPHDTWLEAVSWHRFTACPHGHGLDTHRMMEILLMGGVPVIKRSTISSCFDDSDNEWGHERRGSIPVVIVNTWLEVTKQRLHLEWRRISSVRPEDWDWRRLFAEHWIERLDYIPHK